MKIILALFVYCFLPTLSFAQQDAYVSFTDTTNLYTLGHVIDLNGAAYTLATVTALNTREGNAIEGDYVFGSVITKFDKNNHLSWQKYFQLAAINLTDTYDAWMNFSAADPAKKIFFLDNKLYIIYEIITMRKQPCGSNPAADVRKLACLVLDTSGAVIRNTLFDSTNCERKEMFMSYPYGNNKLGYIAQDIEPTAHYLTHAIVLDENLGKESDILVDSIHVNGVKWSDIFFDTIARHYLLLDVTGLQIFDTTFHLLYILPVPNVGDHVAFGTDIRIDMNADYYAINGQRYKDNTYREWFSQTTILRRDGTLVSLSSDSGVQYCMKFAADNTLWFAGTNLIGNYVQTVVTQKDLFGKVLRRFPVGLAYVYQPHIEVSNGELTISGTYELNNDHFYPNKRANQIFLYRKRISDIPLLPDTAVGNPFIFYPSPATNFAYLVSNDAAATQGATVVIYNSIGQRAAAYTWNAKELQMNVATWPAGIYIIKINSSAGQFVQKFVKL